MGITAIKNFYLGQGTTPSGDTVTSLQRKGSFWNVTGYYQLEKKHDYIQWLFPLSVPSAFQKGAPLIQPWEAVAFKRRDPQGFAEVQQKMKRSLDLMLGFYGLKRTSDGKITQKRFFFWRSSVWLTRDNHNLLRLTRILRSLNLFGLHDEAKYLFGALQGIYEMQGKQVISPRTFSLWTQAASQDSTLYQLYSYARSCLVW